MADLNRNQDLNKSVQKGDSIQQSSALGKTPEVMHVQVSRDSNTNECTTEGRKARVLYDKVDRNLDQHNMNESQLSVSDKNIMHPQPMAIFENNKIESTTQELIRFIEGANANARQRAGQEGKKNPRHNIEVMVLNKVDAFNYAFPDLSPSQEQPAVTNVKVQTHTAKAAQMPASNHLTSKTHRHETASQDATKRGGKDAAKQATAQSTKGKKVPASKAMNILTDDNTTCGLELSPTFSQF